MGVEETTKPEPSPELVQQMHVEALAAAMFPGVIMLSSFNAEGHAYVKECGAVQRALELAQKLVQLNRETPAI